MNKIAFILGEILIYWNSVIMALAIFTGVILFWAAFIRNSDNIAGGAVLCPAAIAVSFVLARLIHWYFRADSYDGFLAAMTDFSGTGYALSGAFLGCLLSALVLRILGILRDFPAALDSLSVGGCAAIAVGRLGCFFTADNRGDILSGVTNLPLAYPVVNPTSGAVEYRFATFLFQAVVAALIFAMLLMLLLRSPDKRRFRDGDIALLFLLMYSASQMVLDSTRYDALRLRSNGFISVVQVLGLVAVLAVLMILSVRLCRNGGKKGILIPVWLGAAGLIGTAAYMEYHVQRHGDQALFAYSVMSCCLAMTVLLGVLLWRMSLSSHKPKKQYKGKFSK